MGQGWLSLLFDVSGLIRVGRVWYKLGLGWSVEAKVCWHLIWVGSWLVEDSQKWLFSNVNYLIW